MASNTLNHETYTYQSLNPQYKAARDDMALHSRSKHPSHSGESVDNIVQSSWGQLVRSQPALPS